MTGFGFGRENRKRAKAKTNGQQLGGCTALATWLPDERSRCDHWIYRWGAVARSPEPEGLCVMNLALMVDQLDSAFVVLQPVGS